MTNPFLSSSEKPSLWKASLNALLLSVLVVWGFVVLLSKIGVLFDFSFLFDYRIRLLDGFVLTLQISFCSMVLSLLLGLISAYLQDCKVLMLRYLAKGYVTFIRGTPLITQIYLFYYIIGTAFGLSSRFWSGVLVLSIFEGAYLSEILRGSFLSLDQTQLEAAKAVGFTKVQTLRYVVFPQLLSRTLPALTGQFASIIKDSSLLSMIAVIELTQTMREISATNFKLFECYLALGVCYLLFTFPISLITKRLERIFAYEH